MPIWLNLRLGTAAAMTHASKRWHSIRITGSERRQMAAVRYSLDAKYLKHVGCANSPNISVEPEHLSISRVRFLVGSEQCLARRFGTR